MKIQKRYRYRIYPDEKQRVFLEKTFGGCRFTYNHILNEIKSQYAKYKEDSTATKPDTSSITLGYRIKPLRKEYTWLEELPFFAIQQSAYQLGKAFSNFFKGKGSKAIPRFKTKRSRQSFTLSHIFYKTTDRGIILSKLSGVIPVKWSRELPEEVTSVTILKESDGKYYASFSVKVEPRLTNGQGKLGLDLGVTDIVVLSDGTKISNPRHFVKKQKQLKRLQRRLSKKEKWSNNWNKERLKIARLHTRIRYSRDDFHHKLARQLVNENQVIAIESLNIVNMMKNRSLAKHIGDVAWGKLIGLTKQKADESNWCRVIHVHPFFPSTQLCSGCNERHQGKLNLSIRSWVCQSCGLTHDRDINAANNIIKVVDRFGSLLTNGSMLTMRWSDLVTTGFYK